MVKYNGVRVTGKDYNWPCYKFLCDCGSEDHALWIEVEDDIDDDSYPLTFLKFEKTFRWTDFYGKYNDSWFYRLKKRLKTIWKLLTKGEIEIYEEMVIDGVEHIDTFIEILQECREQVKKNRELWGNKENKNGNNKM